MDTELTTMSVPEAGKLLGLGRALSFRLAREGKIPAIRLGKKLRVPRVALERMLQRAGQNEEAER